MAKKPKPVPCPTCGRTFKNAGGLASHRRLAKDSAHVAARGDPAPYPAPDPTPTPEPAPEGPKEPEPMAPEAAPEPAPEPVAPVEVPQQEAGPLQVRFQAPAIVQPLSGAPEQEAAAGDGKKAEGASGEVKKDAKGPTVNDIPLEPFIAGSVASVCNGFFLDERKGDGQVSRQEVGETGFPKAIEVSIRKYYPDLPLDHPAVLCALSGAGLAALVQSKKAKEPSVAERLRVDEGEPKKRQPRQRQERKAESEPEEAPDERGWPEASRVKVTADTPSKEGALYAAMLQEGGMLDE